MLFLDKNLGSLIDNFRSVPENEKVELFNKSLINPDFSGRERELYNQYQINRKDSEISRMSDFVNNSNIFNRDNNSKERIISIKNLEKVTLVKNKSKSINSYLQFKIFSSAKCFWIDLKELFILMRINLYPKKLFDENFAYIFAYNLHLCLFETNYKCFKFLSYMLSIIFSGGYEGYYSSSVSL